MKLTWSGKALVVTLLFRMIFGEVNKNYGK